MKIDLHTHSTYSDGTLEPEELISKAREFGITHLALADHDSTGGLKGAREKALGFGMTLIPAIEINTKESTAVHILGYLIHEEDENLQIKLQSHRDIRAKRTEIILEKLKHMGIKISQSDFSFRNKAAAIGRPHIADKLKEKGIVFSRQEAFDKFLSKGRPAYAYYDGPSPQEAIDIILAAKGIPVVAHPGNYVSEETIISLAQLGLQGIEVYYPKHSPDQVKVFLQMAKKHGLIATGGSDYHGPGSGHENMGQVHVPEEVYEKLVERKNKLFG